MTKLEAALCELLNAIDAALVDWEDESDAGLLAAANKARLLLEKNGETK